MPRLVITSLVALGLIGFCVYGVLSTYLFKPDAPLHGYCEDWLNRPGPRWLELRNCTLDTHQLVLESEQGDLEPLMGRLEGLSTRIYDTPPTWVAAWAPVRDERNRSSLVRAAFRLDSVDLMNWLNALDRAPQLKREQMWADPVQLMRVVKPGLLQGRAEKPTTDALQKSWGSLATPALLIITPGVAPKTPAPVLAVFAGLAGVALLFWSMRKLSGATGGPLGAPTAEQELTALNVSDVKVEIGALEELRAEERANRRASRDEDR